MKTIDSFRLSSNHYRFVLKISNYVLEASLRLQFYYKFKNFKNRSLIYNKEVDERCLISDI